MNPRLRVVLALALLGVFTVAVWWVTRGGPPTFANDEDRPDPPIHTTKGPLVLSNAHQCKECHPLVYEEWSTSHHGIAFTNPEPRRPELSDDFKVQDCISCHAPRPIIEVGWGRRPLERENNREDGVDCFACHRYRNVMAAANTLTSASINAPCNPVLWEAVKQVALCAPCHDQHKVHQDWQQTQYGPDGPNTMDCNECHMPVTPGPGTLRSGRDTHRHHGFHGSHHEPTLRSASQLSTALVQGEEGDRLFTISIANTGVGHNFPADERHRAVDLTVQFIPNGGEPGDEVRLARFRNPYRHEYEILNHFKEKGRPVTSTVDWDTFSVAVTQVRIPAEFNPDRHEHYKKSTQLLAGEARGIWFNAPFKRPGRIVVRTYYKLNPLMTDSDAVKLDEQFVDVSEGASLAAEPAARTGSYLGLEAAAESSGVDVIDTAAYLGSAIPGSATARLIADESGGLDARLDAMAGLDGTAGQAEIDALLLAMKDRSQQAFLMVPDDSELGYHVAESPFGGLDTRAELRWTAIMALDRLGTLQAIPDLLAAIHDRHPVARNHAAHALWRLGFDDGIEVLLTALDGKAFENETAISILREISGQAFGFNTDGGYVNKQAAIGRWRAYFADGYSNPNVRPTVGGDEALDRRVRFQVAMLGQHQFLFMEQARRNLSALDELALDAIEIVLQRPDAAENNTTQAYAVQVLASIAADGTDAARIEARRRIIERLSTRTSPAACARAAKAAGELKLGAATTALEDLLAVEDESIIIAAAEALARIDAKAQASTLRSLFASVGASKRLRQVVACGLWRAGDLDLGVGAFLLGILREGERFQRAELARFIEMEFGDLKGYDPEKPGTEQPDAITAWRLVLAPR